MEQKKKSQFNFWYFFIAFWLIIILRQFYMEQAVIEPISYSQFERDVEAGRISQVYVHDQHISGEYSKPLNGKTKFTTPLVEKDIAETLSKHGVEYTGVKQNNMLASVISWVVPTALFFAIWWFLLKRMSRGGSGFMTVGQSKSQVYVNRDTGVTFDQVAGVDEAKEELQEVIQFLKNPKDYGRLGAHIPKGILLVGPPGTGKTLLAKAVAGEAKVPFFSISGSEFIEMFVGVGAARVRDLFDKAKEHAPAIIFIDELDALGRARGTFNIGGGHDEREQTLNQLLAEMDGFDTKEGVVILAATNRPEILDAALLRSGRFDRQVLVDRPNKQGRVDILKVHIRKIVLCPDVKLEKVAAMTTGFSGADLANLVNEAAIQATRRDAKMVTMEDFTKAIERIVAGAEKKSQILTAFERKAVAYHEMGHALVSLALPDVDAVHKVSIIPRGIGALGYTIQRPTEDRHLMTREELVNKITVLLGGRAAEMLIFKHTSTGASDDLAKATQIAHSMVVHYGMDEKLGPVAYEEQQNLLLGNRENMFMPKKYSEETAKQIDATTREIISEAFDHATKILKDNKKVLEKCAVELLKTETLEEEELRDLVKNMKLTYTPSKRKKDDEVIAKIHPVKKKKHHSTFHD
jgi:cell division protease FtsH